MIYKYICAIFLCLNLSIAEADITQPRVSVIDHSSGRIVIGDGEFYFKLNTKVYDKKRLVNRYALKVGQQVDFETTVVDNKRYLISIIILPG